MKVIVSTENTDTSGKISKDTDALMLPERPGQTHGSTGDLAEGLRDQWFIGDDKRAWNPGGMQTRWDPDLEDLRIKHRLCSFNEAIPRWTSHLFSLKVHVDLPWWPFLFESDLKLSK